MGGRLISSLILTGAILATAPCALAATEYDVIDLPGMNASNGFNYARALNDLGQVVGGNSHVLLYSGGTTQELDFQNIAIPTVGTGINDSGQIVGFGFSGQSGKAGQASQAFFYSNGTDANLASLLPYPGASWAHSVNASGEAVVENYETVNGGPDHLLTYQNGIVTDLHVTGFSPTIINDLGHIAGTVNQRASFYDGQVHDLGTPAGDVSVASGMNNSDQIVGYIRDGSTGAASAYLYSNGAITELGTLHGDNSYAYAINNLGQIVGSSDSNVVLGGAFIDSNDQMTDLNTLIAPGGNPQGLHIDDAFGISDSGYILGTGSTLGPSPTYETVLLVPATPEPGACGIALIATAGLLRRRRAGDVSLVSLVK